MFKLVFIFVAHFWWLYRVISVFLFTFCYEQNKFTYKNVRQMEWNKKIRKQFVEIWSMLEEKQEESVNQFRRKVHLSGWYCKYCIHCPWELSLHTFYQLKLIWPKTTCKTERRVEKYPSLNCTNWIWFAFPKPKKNWTMAVFKSNGLFCILHELGALCVSV